MTLVACKTTKVESVAERVDGEGLPHPIRRIERPGMPRQEVGEHSENTFLVMYDGEVGKGPLLEAIERYGVEIIYDYSIINGMALKKPEKRGLEETMDYFRKVKGVTAVEYDHIYRLTDPVRPIEVER